MTLDIKLAQFDGPFDLLLSLVAEQKLDISQLSLAQITEQYLAYLDTLSESRADELADFLVVATRLLLLKSSRLLPQFAPEEDDGPSLESQLKLYQAFLIASKTINQWWLSPAVGAFRVEPARPPTAFVLPANFSLGDLRQCMVQLIQRLTPPKALPQTQIDRAVSLKAKIDQIRTLLGSSRFFSFTQIITQSQNRTEIIVSFLAILELVKLGTVGLRQEGSFGEIVVRRT